MRSYLELVGYRVVAELRTEMARAYLGLLWWVLEPLLYMLVFYFVFAVLFERGGPGYVPFLLCGLVAWRWFDSTVRAGSVAIESNKVLIQQAYVPKWVFPLVMALTNTAKFLIVLCLLLGFLLLYGVTPTLAWASLPLVLAIQFCLVLGAGSSVAAVVPFVPDLKILINNGLTLLMFLSGIFYSISDAPPSVQPLFLMNPMAALIDTYRQILIEGVWPDWGSLLIVALISAALLSIASFGLRRFDRLYPKLML
jgi:lipopolysaccharide transport system permease protein